MSYTIHTTAGENDDPVAVSFEVSSDGDLEDMEVVLMADAGEKNIVGELSASEIESLEDQCWDHYLKECNEHNTDLAISRHLSSQDC